MKPAAWKRIGPGFYVRGVFKIRRAFGGGSWNVYENGKRVANATHLATAKIEAGKPHIDPTCLNCLRPYSEHRSGFRCGIFVSYGSPDRGGIP